MATYNKFNIFTSDCLRGIHNLESGGDIVRAFLTNQLPLATNTIKANIAEITAENGYVAGGPDIENDVVQALGVGSMTGVDKTITAAGGTVGPFKYVVLYNDTSTSDSLIGWAEYSGAALTLQDTEEFLIDFLATIIDLE